MSGGLGGGRDPLGEAARWGNECLRGIRRAGPTAGLSFLRGLGLEKPPPVCLPFTPPSAQAGGPASLPLWCRISPPEGSGGSCGGRGAPLTLRRQRSDPAPRRCHPENVPPPPLKTLEVGQCSTWGGPQGKDSARMRRRHWVRRELGEEPQSHPSPRASFSRQTLLAHREEKGPESRRRPHSSLGPRRALGRALGMRPLGEKRGRRCLGMRAALSRKPAGTGALPALPGPQL